LKQVLIVLCFLLSSGGFAQTNGSKTNALFTAKTVDWSQRIKRRNSVGGITNPNDKLYQIYLLYNPKRIINKFGMIPCGTS
jgi:hypothetical protein